MGFGRLQDVSFRYINKQEYALRNLNFSFEQGQFILFTGPSGSGKTTLLNLINGMVPFFYNGELTGRVIYKGQALERIPDTVGTVFQDPDKQLLRGSVLKELVFGLENMGLSPWEMKRRIGELISFLGIEGLLDKQVRQLSGGEKQLICIASILAMRPEVLVLDEPTAQLDPAAADSFLGLIRKVNRDLGMTVLISEQRLDKCYDIADQVIYLEKGEIKKVSSPREMAEWQIKEGKEYLPVISKLFIPYSLGTPLTVKEGKSILKKISFNSEQINCRQLVREQRNIPLIELQKVNFSYEKEKQVLKKINLKLYKGEFVVLCGANGAGKTSLLKILSGFLNPSQGRIKFKDQPVNKGNGIKQGSIGYLPQNLGHYFCNQTVLEEMRFNAANLKDVQSLDLKVERLIEQFALEGIIHNNPRELSAGEQQRVALASLLASEPELILLDEPTKGLDYENKKQLGIILTNLADKGISVFLITHDLEFAAEYGKRMLIMFEGEIVVDGLLKEVLQNNWFYTTQLNLTFRNKLKGIVNYADASKALEGINEKI